MILAGKASMVTGAGQGIGAAIAKAIAAEGGAVLVNDVQQDKALSIAREINESGGKAAANADDISTFPGAQRAVAACVSNFGKIDILVNNAGVLRDRMCFNMTQEEWDLVIQVCLTGTFACAQQAIILMRKQGSGRIINVSSTSGLRGNVGQSNYAAAKAGVLGLTLTLSQEVSKYGITVNGLVPSARTTMTASVPAAVRAKKDAGQVSTVVRKRGEPEDVAPVVVFLASDEADWVNGQMIGVSGDKLALWAHPREKLQTYMSGGWRLPQIRETFKAIMGRDLETTGKSY